MASTYTSKLRLTLPATGDLNGLWGGTVNSEITSLIEQALAGRAAIAMTDADYTPTALNGTSDEARNMVLRFTGTLTANRNIIVPTQAKLYIIENATTGGFALTVKTAAGSGVSVPSATASLVRCDATNVVGAYNVNVAAAQGVLPVANGGTGAATAAAAGLALTGELKTWSTAVAPTGWLLCNGAAVSRATYAALFAVIGTTFGVGDGATTFNVPNTVNRAIVGSGGLYALGATGGSKDASVVNHVHPFTSGAMSANATHSHTASDSGHTHPAGLGVILVGGGSVSGVSSLASATGSGFANITVTSTNTDHTHSGTTSNPTGGVAVTDQNMMPYIALAQIIKT